MKFTLRMPAVLTALLLLLAAGSVVVFMSSAIAPSDVTPPTHRLPNTSLPILPLPQHADQLNGTLKLGTIAALKPVGLSAEEQQRLWWHWDRFKKEQAATAPGAPIQVGLIGKDKAFDKLVTQAASTWINRIGNEGYVLILQNNQRLLAAKTEAGLFYGMQSLKQLIRAGWSREVRIADWPSLAYRVIYDDISRGPISTVAHIKQQIERMAELKINGLSFYIEHIVQPLSHPDFAPANGKLTIADIKELSAYADKFHLQLIGSFQSFGHFEKILSLPQYAPMGATVNLISPTNAQARKFLEDVIGELCDAFHSPYFNVNCDETFDLGQGTSKPDVEKIGAATYYANHLKFLYDIVHRHGKKMMMWGDFAIEHPEVLDLLPKDVMYLTWEYGDQASFDHWIKPFADRGLSYMVCPGILNSYRMFPDMIMAKANIEGFISAGVQHNTQGAITTIWDDGGTYLFAADWYGVYVAAEKSWKPDTSGNLSFDQRYEQNAYGAADANYVKALFKLMELRALPLTYNLNDRLWQQKLLPDSGKKLILNNTSAAAALHILDEANGFLSQAKATRHQTDLQTLAFSIDQYRLMIESRTLLAGIAAKYERAARAPSTASTASFLGSAASSVDDLARKYESARNEFKRLWLGENQLYWLDVVLASYDRKIADLKELQKNLKDNETAAARGGAIASASRLRLSIEDSPSFYFQNWMLTGPFPVAQAGQFPSFLYSDSPEYNKPPSPGDFTQYLGKLYRWKKFASSDGGIVDLDENYPQKSPSIVYAYCSLTADRDTTVSAFIQGNVPMELFCNGKAIAAMQTANGLQAELALHAGVNHVLLKLRKENDNSWAFTFKLRDDLVVTNHKHKYQLNSKKESYDAE